MKSNVYQEQHIAVCLPMSSLLGQMSTLAIRQSLINEGELRLFLRLISLYFEMRTCDLDELYEILFIQCYKHVPWLQLRIDGRVY